VLCALNAAQIDHQDPAIRKAVAWLVSIQNEDGGWGEDAISYRLDYKGFEGAPSTASQTAWALLGLMAAGEVGHPAVARGVEYLIATQTEKGLWMSSASRQQAFLGCFICAIMDIRSSFRSGRWRGIGI